MENCIALSNTFDAYAVGEKVSPENLIVWMKECNVISDIGNITPEDIDVARLSVSVDANGLTLKEVLGAIRILAKNKERDVKELYAEIMEHADAGEHAEIEEEMIEDDKRKGEDQQPPM